MYLSFELLENRLAPATYTVIYTNDAGPANGQPGGIGNGNSGDLRYCINQADNLANAGSTIVFGVNGPFKLSAALPDISQNMTISGQAGNPPGVQGSATAQTPYRIFTIDKGITAEFDNIGISGGYDASGSGGGILNKGNLTLNGDTISGNQTTGNGGAISNNGQLSLINSIVSNNNAGEFGGGVYNSGSGTVNISGSSSELNNNRAANGGAIFNGVGCTLTIKSGTTIDYNTVSGGGGGIENTRGKATLTGATIYENFAGSGGGIYMVGGTLKLTANCYVYNNGARLGNGGGMLMNGGTASISGGTFQGNIASGNGGGIYLMSGALTLQGDVNIGPSNSATNGGGLYLASNSKTTFSGCIIGGNKATGKGVGVAYETGAFWLNFANGLTDNDDLGGQPVKV